MSWLARANIFRSFEDGWAYFKHFLFLSRREQYWRRSLGSGKQLHRAHLVDLFRAHPLGTAIGSRSVVANELVRPAGDFRVFTKGAE